mmetsp:Transcript_58971/g.68925  ORF Transcript_58971/g.68925 Transcript_58971/m.68925 type:complete len:92 (+) Transcript_58971:1042-1317(+)
MAYLEYAKGHSGFMTDSHQCFVVKGCVIFIDFVEKTRDENNNTKVAICTLPHWGNILLVLLLILAHMHLCFDERILYEKFNPKRLLFFNIC